MSSLNVLALIVNSLTLVMTFEFSLIILWHNPRRHQNLFFSGFLFTVAVWSVASLLTLFLVETDTRSPLLSSSIRWIEIGFVSSAIAIYAFTAVMVGVLSRRFRVLLLLSWAGLILYQSFFLSAAPLPTQPLDASTLIFEFSGIYNAFYLVFTFASYFLLWRYRGRVTSPLMRMGIFLFLLGQLISLLNPAQSGIALSVITCSVGVLLIGVSVLRQEIITPLRERTSQVKTMHDMSLAITSQLSLDVILQQIADQTAERLDADGVGVFLQESGGIRFAATQGLPTSLLDTTLSTREGVVGTVISRRKTILLEDYTQEWQRAHDIPFADEAFGAVICVPLNYADMTVGALLAVVGRRKHAFNEQDAHMLEMLGAQAAVAITHGQLFTQQQTLTEEIASARNQLETLLASTENPVIAVNRNLEMIFANAAAERLFPQVKQANQPLTEILPGSTLPSTFFKVYRDIRRQRVHIYEISFEDHAYLAHIAALEEGGHIQGWVVVLNDVTNLKELDRLKSEMVRMTSHDLKNPLQAALAHIDLLDDTLSDTDDEEIHTSLRIIEKQLTRMFRIISGVLDMERVRAGKSTIQICQADEVLIAAIEDMQQLANDKGVTLTSAYEHDLPPLQGDAGQIERALANLIENAIKFTPTGGAIHARVCRDDQDVCFEISDTGIGIPKESHTDVFSSFFRANQKGAEHISGTGLGLHLVKTIIENHQGKVWLQSEENVGTTFFVSIPTRQDAIV